MGLFTCREDPEDAEGVVLDRGNAWVRRPLNTPWGTNLTGCDLPLGSEDSEVGVLSELGIMRDTSDLRVTGLAATFFCEGSRL